MGRENMEIKILTYTREPEKTCAVSMRSTRTGEPAHKLWKSNWATECPESKMRKLTGGCPKKTCSFYLTCAVRLLRSAKKMKHWGVFEHATFTVSVSGVSRSLTHQLVRHRIASYLQQSQRAVAIGTSERNFSGIGSKDWYVIPDSIRKSEFFEKYNAMMERISVFYQEMLKGGIKAEDARFVLPNATKTHIVITMNARTWMHFFRLRLSVHAQWEIREMANLICGKLTEISPLIFEGAGELEI